MGHVSRMKGVVWIEGLLGGMWAGEGKLGYMLQGGMCFSEGECGLMVLVCVVVRNINA